MTEAEELSHLIDAIYDTTVDPDLWISVLEKTAAFVGGVAATLASHDTTSGEGNIFYVWGDDLKYRQHYIEHLARLNPLMIAAHLYKKPGDVFSASELYPYDEFQRSRIFLEWVKPQGWGDFTHSLIEKSGSRFGHFGVANALEDSPAGEEPRRRLRLLMPHVIRAVAIGRAMELQKLKAETMSATLDALSAGVFLVTEKSAIVYANESGQAMLDKGGAVRAANGVLEATISPAKEELKQAIAGARSPDGGDGKTAVILLPLPQQEHLVAHVVALTSGERQRAGKLLGATAAVFVHKADLQRPTVIQSVAKHFGLTEAETRVAFLVLEAGGVPEIAAALGVSEQTVKTHLQRIFRKTDTKRQAELVQLISGMVNPMVQ